MQQCQEVKLLSVTCTLGPCLGLQDPMVQHPGPSPCLQQLRGAAKTSSCTQGWHQGALFACARLVGHSHQQHGARSWAALKWGWCCRTDFGGQAGSVWFMVTANAKLLRCHRCHGGPWRRMLMVGCVELLLAHPPAPSHTSGPVCAVESSKKHHGQSVFARGWGRSSSCEAQMTFGRGSSHCSQA